MSSITLKISYNGEFKNITILDSEPLAVLEEKIRTTVDKTFKFCRMDHRINNNTLIRETNFKDGSIIHVSDMEFNILRKKFDEFISENYPFTGYREVIDSLFGKLTESYEPFYIVEIMVNFLKNTVKETYAEELARCLPKAVEKELLNVVRVILNEINLKNYPDNGCDASLIIIEKLNETRGHLSPEAEEISKLINNAGANPLHKIQKKSAAKDLWTRETYDDDIDDFTKTNIDFRNQVRDMTSNICGQIDSIAQMNEH